ncbi:MAG: glutamate--tRNA ligase [Peptococcaceae bacterium]|jgi:nondiscriminating glutamyl-tRNA synthetase|nr:glutamate--tRNA ligase [Peptococcaceae bacterium]MDH7526122.1 glutamate--tRNA ligase [Peptococcaceae bacterium]
MEAIRVRFAPSPTGPLHIGGARSALFNFLFARNKNGKFIMRIEDTDLERSSRESERNILESLKWLGITWDEGPDIGGSYGPYRQTERLSIYREYTERLLAEGKAYHCYCTEEELEKQRKEFFDRGELPRYSGKCFHLSLQEKEKYEKEGRVPVIRFHVPENKNIVVNDLVRGEVVFESGGIGDFVIVKSDGIPTYNYAVVIDDALMKISHVIRAEEHLSNTPRQVLLYEALGFPLPEFAHISLILGEDRSKMSKRHGATSIVQYREMGYLPESLINFLALLGWSPGGEEEIMDLEELVARFSLDRVAKNPAVFDLEKLRWMNGFYIRKSPAKRIAKMAVPYLQEAGYLSRVPTEKDMKWAELVVTALQEHLSTISEIVEHMDILAGEDVVLESDEAKALLREDTFPAVINSFRRKINELDELTPENIKNMMKSITKELKLSGRQVYMPVRAALTGRTHGPELFYIIPVLGKDLALRRIARTLEQAGVDA